MGVRNEYVIKGSAADGEIVSPKMSINFDEAFIKVLFYTDDTYLTQIVPSAGTIVFTASEEGITYGTVPFGVVDVTEINYDRPNWSGPALYTKAVCSAIVGASHFRAVIYRRGT